MSACSAAEQAAEGDAPCYAKIRAPATPPMPSPTQKRRCQAQAIYMYGAHTKNGEHRPRVTFSVGVQSVRLQSIRRMVRARQCTRSAILRYVEMEPDGVAASGSGFLSASASDPVAGGPEVTKAALADGRASETWHPLGALLAHHFADRACLRARPDVFIPYILAAARAELYAAWHAELLPLSNAAEATQLREAAQDFVRKTGGRACRHAFPKDL